MPSEAIERLYEVYGRVPRPDRVEGCPHCVDPDEDRRLLARPVRELPAETLERYAFKAITTWGGVAEFRYFLPRLVELAVAGAFGDPDPQVIFGKLAYGRGGVDERAAIEALLTDWWAETLASAPPPDTETVLCCIGVSGTDMDPYLARWSELSTAMAVRRLHGFAWNGVRWSPTTRLADAYWDVHGSAHRQVITWLTAGAAGAAVRAAFETETRDDVLELLADLDAVLP
jgi:hypothetical protein